MKEKNSMSRNNPIDAPPEIYKDGELLVVSLNVRRSPNKDSPVVFILNRGTPFKFSLTDDPDWCVIASATTKTAGYAMAKFIREVVGGSS